MARILAIALMIGMTLATCAAFPAISRAKENDAYDKMPVLPPIPPGDSPSDDEVLRTLDQLDPGFGLEAMRRNVKIIKEKQWESVDPPRNYPLVGWAQLHHTRWKCTLTYTKVVLPISLGPPRIIENSVEVVDIDHDHLHAIKEPTDRPHEDKPSLPKTVNAATSVGSLSNFSTTTKSQSVPTKQRRARWLPFFLR